MIAVATSEIRLTSTLLFLEIQTTLSGRLRNCRPGRHRIRDAGQEPARLVSVTARSYSVATVLLPALRTTEGIFAKSSEGPNDCPDPIAYRIHCLSRAA